MRRGANQASPTYLKWIKAFPLASIRDDKHLEQATQVLHALLARPSLDAGEEQYLDALTDLVEVYESHHVPLATHGDAAVLAYLLELKGISQATVAEATGIQKSTISEVLSGKRLLTRQHIATLASYFGIGQQVFASEKSEPAAA